MTLYTYDPTFESLLLTFLYDVSWNVDRTSCCCFVSRKRSSTFCTLSWVLKQSKNEEYLSRIVLLLNCVGKSYVNEKRKQPPPVQAHSTLLFSAYLYFLRIFIIVLNLSLTFSCYLWSFGGKLLSNDFFPELEKCQSLIVLSLSKTECEVPPQLQNSSVILL